MIKRIWDITLTVKDLPKAISFYETILGLQKKYEFSDYVGFDCGGIELGLKTWGEAERPRKGEPAIDFLVDDIDEAFLRLQHYNVKALGPPKTTEWGGRIIQFYDPDEHLLQLVQVIWKDYFKVCTKGK